MRQADAFQIETPITYGCHEKITVDAHEAAGFPDRSLAPQPTEDQRRAADDLTFTLPADNGDVWTMTILVGVRYNDIKAFQIIDPASFVSIHDDPADQHAHCIRRIEDDYEEGDASALRACRDFILDELATGRWFNDQLDFTTTEPVPMYLAFRHRVDVDLPRFAFRLGRAIHALEDGFAHTLRNPDDARVRHVTNWIDFSTDDDYDVARDGLHHLAPIDDCLRNTEVERYHVLQARAAVTELLLALREVDPGESGESRRTRARVVLDNAFRIEPGCNIDNDYCGAGELAESSPGCTSTRGTGWLALLLVVGVLAPLRRRRTTPVLALVLVLATPRGVLAAPLLMQTTPQQTSTLGLAPEKPLVWHVDFRFGAALDHAALAFIGGVGLDRYNWTFGLAVEWNPWFSLDTSRAHQGALNIYGTLARRWYDDERFTLYSRAELGTSTILFDLVGVDEYDTGVYFGGSLLGVAIKKRSGLRMTIDPSHFSMPVPKPSGLPFYWRQYRIAIGLELRFE